MPFCSQCGAANVDSARFCDQCGAELTVINAPPPPTPPPSAGAIPDPAGVAEAPPAPPDSPMPAVSAGPGTCPQCGMTVIPGEAFCDSCGASLLEAMAPASQASPVQADNLPPQQNYPPPQPAAQPAASTPDPAPAPAAQPVVPSQKRTTLAPAQLMVQPGGDVISLPSTNQAVVGRSDPVSKFYPDIDLAPYGALEQGVGRRHIRLFVRDDQIYVEDLDSTNGTLHNKTRLPPHTPRPFNHGDELYLGKLILYARVQEA